MTAALRRPALAAEPGPAGARLRVGLRRWGRAVWRALEAHGERRAQRVLHELAMQRQASNPELARQLLDLSARRTGAAQR